MPPNDKANAAGELPGSACVNILLDKPSYIAFTDPNAKFTDKSKIKGVIKDKKNGQEWGGKVHFVNANTLRVRLKLTKEARGAVDPPTGLLTITVATGTATTEHVVNVTYVNDDPNSPNDA